MEGQMGNLRKFFRLFNKFMLFMWRLGLDRWMSFWPEGFGQFMVINHTGRKSGLTRRSPVNFAYIEGEIFCVAGFGSLTDWYQNILVNAKVEVWLPDSRWLGNAENIPLDKTTLPILREVLRCSGFAAILAGVKAMKTSDADLLAICKDYCLVHIKRIEARTGSGGPGDLAWVWPVAFFVMLPFIFRKKK
jgi:deazaflavin-dependent oxidoreductase (nitroreductase family)